MEPKAPFANCSECPLRDRPFVAGYGPLMTDRVIVGEAPGKTEVFRGKPFVGTAGKRLNKALSANGVDRRALYITNTLLCQPTENDLPQLPQALEACHERLITEIRLRMPRKVLALGRTASKALTDNSGSIEDLRRDPPSPIPDLGDHIEVRVTYHPSAVPRNREWSERFDEDVGWLVDP